MKYSEEIKEKERRQLLKFHKKETDLFWVVLNDQKIRQSCWLQPTLHGHQMVTVNYGPVVAQIRHWRTYNWIYRPYRW